MNLARTSIRNPVATVMFMLAVILIGAVSFTKLDIDLMPDINPPVAAVITRFPGASAQEVQDLVTLQVEAVAGTASGIKEIMSVSQEETSLVVLMFDWGKKVGDARADVTQRLDLLSMPEGASKPVMVEFDPTQMPVMQVTVSESGDIGYVTQYVRDKVKPRLEAVEGVAAVELVGAADKRVNVWLDPAKLAANGLTQDAVAMMISASNLNYPLGSVQEDGLMLQMRMIGKFMEIDDIAETVVGYIQSGTADVKPVLLKDVATVEEGYADATSLTRVNGKPGVTLAIQREGTANAVSVSRGVKDELDKIAEDLGIDVSVSMDQARFIEFTIKTVESNLLIGAGLAVLVLLVFLRDFRTTLVISLSIPFSLIATLVLLYAARLTLNIMTLGGLALGVGMLVDNSIVVIENIFRHTQDGEDPRVAAETGAREVAMAITASTLTTVIVFLPVTFVGGITGIIFKELALTVTFSLLASLVVALTVVPMLASRLFGRKKDKRSVHDLKQGNTRPNGVYASAVKWSLRSRALILVVVIAMLGGTVFLGRKIPSEFLPVSDEGSFSMDISMKPGTTLEDVDKAATAIENVLAKEKSIDTYSVTVGQSGETASFQSGVMGGWDAQVLVTVTKEVSDKKETSEFMESLEKKIDKVRGDASVAYNMTSSVMMMAGDLTTQVQVRVSGPDVAEVGTLADDLVARMTNVDGLRNVKSSLTEVKPEIHLMVDKEKALRYGLTPAQIALAVSRSVKGQTVSRYQSGDTILDIVVGYEKSAVMDATAIGELTLLTGRGRVAVKDIAKVEEGTGPLAISRQDRRLSARVTGQISGRSLGSISNDVSDIIDDMDFPDGYQAELGGVSEIMTESFSSLSLVLALAAVLVYMVMAASFESFAQPLILMLTMPLAGIGTILALYLGNSDFGITAFIGVIILAGVVVNNGIVMVDFMNQLRAAGMPLADAIVQGAASRLRPVLMTSLTTVVGLIPMATGLGEGAELTAPLALALMGGLTSGTFLTLFVIPVVYSVFTRERRVPQVPQPSQVVVDGVPVEATVGTIEAPATATPRDVSSDALVLGSAFESKDMAELVELLGKLFTSVQRKSV
ncbi:MAG: efflux RND transporter permease subunit [Bacillota bacterium]